MGGSGGSSYFGRSTDQVASKLRASIAQAEDAQFETELAAAHGELLARFNTRNAQETEERLQRIKDVLGDILGGTVDTLFGGSVAKHTYVDGISDVDSLLVLDETDAADGRPKQALNAVRDRLAEELRGEAEVSAGAVAVTVKYIDGTELQLVPARRVGDRLEVPAWESNTWSPIDPQQFRDGLTKRNAQQGGKVVPTIKLAKAICANLPEELRPSGYHLESLAVSAFRHYAGEKTTPKMLAHFFEAAKTLVLAPMKDRTGQSVHVDENLGPENSPARQQLSRVLDRISRRLTNARASHSLPRWLELFGE